VFGSETKATAVSPTVIPKEAFGANDRIRVAVLGVNGRGQNHIEEAFRKKMIIFAPDISNCY
jgi:hypothetical protein